LSPEQREDLRGALKAHFEKNMNGHKGLEWAKVQAQLEVNAGLVLPSDSPGTLKKSHHGFSFMCHVSRLSG
jgi:hypothetical protein